jgi:hypothetical protein
MQRDVGDRLIDSTHADLDSVDEWGHAEQFFYETLLAVYGLLPVIAQEQLSHRGPALPSEDELEVLRVALWRAIEDDSMGYTVKGAAVRATLFAFSPREQDGPLDAVTTFCRFFCRAGLPEDVLVGSFCQQWPLA